MSDFMDAGLRTMEDDFGVLPHPKLSADQEHFISATGQPHMMCIPINAPDLARTSIILEAQCYESMKSVKREFYDVLLTQKITGRDNESAEMLDIIFANKIYDLGFVYWKDQLAATIYDLIWNNKKGQLTSTIETNQARWERLIQDAVDAFAK